MRQVAGGIWELLVTLAVTIIDSMWLYKNNDD